MNIYIDKQPNMINFNDAFFNSYAIPFVKADNNIGATIRNSISKIEDVEFQGKDRIISKYNGYPLNLTELSTGCKTIINVLLSTSFIYTDGKYKRVNCGKGNIVINVAECGANYIKYLYSVKNGNIYMPTYRYTDNLKSIKGSFKIYKNGQMLEAFTNTDDLERWYMTNAQIGIT